MSLVPLEPEGWLVDVNKVRKAFRPNTKFLVTNFPHNPTGSTIDKSSYKTLIELCYEKGVTLVGDEVYHLLEHKKEYRLPPPHSTLTKPPSASASCPKPTLSLASG